MQKVLTEEEKAELLRLLEKVRHAAFHTYHDEVTEAVDTVTTFVQRPDLSEALTIWKAPPFDETVKPEA